MYLDQFGVLRFEFWGGDLQNNPWKKAKIFKNGSPDPYNTMFLFHNHIVWSKIGCLQKTTGQKVKI